MSLCSPLLLHLKGQVGAVMLEEGEQQKESNAVSANDSTILAIDKIMPKTMAT